MRVELLETAACGHAAAAEALVRYVLASLEPTATLDVVTVTSAAQPEAARFGGSPTIRVDGVDLEPDAPVVSGLG